MERCTILVAGYDGYEDSWYPFFKILKANWPEIPYEIVLATQTKSFSYEGLAIRMIHMPAEKVNAPWGARMIEALSQIDTEYILLLIEDFYLLGPVDQNRVEQCLDWMDEDHRIANFSFGVMDFPNIRDEKYPGFERRPQSGPYRLNAQAALWRRKKLISYIRPHESAWDWEILGSQRSERYPELFYTSIKGEPRVFLYDFEQCSICKGKWGKDVPELFEKYGIDIDLSIRGIRLPKDSTTEKRFIHYFRFFYLPILRFRNKVSIRKLYIKYLSLRK